jgi:hypothetical protein
MGKLTIHSHKRIDHVIYHISPRCLVGRPGGGLRRSISAQLIKAAPIAAGTVLLLAVETFVAIVDLITTAM